MNKKEVKGNHEWGQSIHEQRDAKKATKDGNSERNINQTQNS